ncbi:MAG: AAA family ATPase [Syntrophomonadaceae bacterium]|nr:AAA family ATPase [Syntrophomonadaceae bacterium]
MSLPPYTGYEGYIADVLRLGELRFGALGVENMASGEEADADAIAAFMEHMRQRAEASGQAGVFLPLDYLFWAFELNAFERHCVTMALLPELDQRFALACEELLNDPDAHHISVGLALRLYDRPCRRSDIGPCSKLARYFFRPENAAGLFTPLRLDERILSFIFDAVADDPELVPWLTRQEPEPTPKAETGVSAELWRYVETSGGMPPVLFFLHGPEGVGKKRGIRQFCHEADMPLLLVDSALLRRAGGSRLNHRILRECMLHRAALAVCDALPPYKDDEYEENVYSLLNAALKYCTPAFMTSLKEWYPDPQKLGAGVAAVKLELPDNLERTRLWPALAAGFELSGEVDLMEAANTWAFTPGQMIRALQAAREAARLAGSPSIGPAHLRRGCHAQLTRPMGRKAVKINIGFDWDDLILPPWSKKMLQQACDQVRHNHTVFDRWGFRRRLPYGTGLSLLFTGPPGTGKTMAAQIVAGRLGLELYKVNLAGVVSKYIGETEKNLEEIFDDAGQRQAILFFDEADVLFGKRTEMKEANDKYNNMEAAFLLQKMEEYDGIVILATNYMQNFDEAFKRRLKYVIDFPFPDRNYRELLWKSVFPPATPLKSDIDIDYLAGRFELSGSNIKNIAVNAAFAAAIAGGEVGMREIVASIRQELAKGGKVLNREDFGEYRMLLEEP